MIERRRNPYYQWCLVTQRYNFWISQSSRNVSNPLFESLFFLFFFNNMLLLKERKVKDDRRGSSRLAETRRSARRASASSFLEVALSRREANQPASQPASGPNDERAEQTTLKVVCGLSRTRALCRSESPRECAPEERERVSPALPPPIPLVRIPLASCRPRAVPFFDVSSLPPSLLLRVVPPFRPLSCRHWLLRLLSTVLRSSLRWARVWLFIFPLIRRTADALDSHEICQARKLDLMQIHQPSERLIKLLDGKLAFQSRIYIFF